ncbi:hypothetical protein QUF75_01940 [Desulfococcaceae bacterium HSG7]|nr:hypothetical protein [Desulfococcaceae bacterium HSG7]
MLKGGNARPDILILEVNVSPVVIETEVLPATTVEQEAMSRLGQQIRTTGRTILSAIVVRLPKNLRKYQGSHLQNELAITPDLEIALYTGNNPSDCTRWPQSGWIPGNVADLSILVQLSSVPPDIIDEAADYLVSGVSETAGLLGEMAHNYAGAIHKISEELYQEDGEQTRRMAATILANAFMFHEILAGGQGELANVNSLEQLRGASGGFTKSSVLTEWRKILAINYWPIFDIARRILEVVPTQESKPLIEGLASTADKLLQNRLMRSHDLTGAVFQRLIADRKFLAAYYTTPASAALLVGLAIAPEMLSKEKSWSSADDVKSLRIADFACGTGTLLSSAYHRVSQLYEIAGGDAEKLHPQMMANALVGCDVLPAAAHLTASMLAGAHPTVKYNQSSILTVAYGRQSDGAIALGSLNLLEPQGMFEILSITAKAAEGMGESEKQTWQALPHASFDVVIMNPPFTRATGHEGKKIGIPNPMFAAFASSAEEQRLMSKTTKRLTQGTSAHGNAGEASIFLVLGDRKLRADGMLALVMPLSLMSGDAWEASRVRLTKNYSDLILVSIAGADDAELSFSADTDMGECLVIGRKSNFGSTRATFIILNERPTYPLIGASVAEQIRHLITDANIRQLEDGPVGGTLLHFGDDIIGQALDAPLPASGGWYLSRIADLSLAQTAYQMINAKRLWLPTMSKSENIKIPITTVKIVGEIGPYHADINGKTSTGGIRGPFDTVPVQMNSVPTYPILWAHKATRERTISFDADCEGIPRQGKTPQEQELVDQKLTNVWGAASHCHFNRDFRFNSQSTGMQFTPRRTIGGRAWLSVKLATVEQEKVLVLWGNTSLGLLLRWWHSNKQQSGRGSIGKQALHTLPILDITALTPTQMDEAVKIFDAMHNQKMLPMYKIDIDPVRKEMDEEFARKVLNLPESILMEGGPLDILRMKLSREPSVRGNK